MVGRMKLPGRHTMSNYQAVLNAINQATVEGLRSIWTGISAELATAGKSPAMVKASLLHTYGMDEGPVGMTDRYLEVLRGTKGMVVPVPTGKREWRTGVGCNGRWEKVYTYDWSKFEAACARIRAGM